MTETPHDALFKAAFESPADAASMFRSVLPPELSRAIAWDTLTAAHGSFVDPELAGRHTDLLFSARLSEREVLLYLLLEHQSTSDPDMPLRMLVYLVRIWERFRKEGGNDHEPLPAVIPIVISHAVAGWTAPRSFHELFAAEVVGLPSVAALVPSFAIVVEDLARYSNDDIKQLALAAFPTLAVWALRDARDGARLLVNLEHWAHAFVEAYRSPNGAGAIEQLMRYFSFVVDELDLGTFRGKLRTLIPDAEAATMGTLAERLLRQGREEGREAGREEGREVGREEAKIELLVKQLVLRFGTVTPAQRAVIEAASGQMRDRYLERVLTAATIEDVLA